MENKEWSVDGAKFREAETIVKGWWGDVVLDKEHPDYNKITFVLEMLQYGRRCYQTIQPSVWAVGEVGEVNKRIRKGFAELERNTKGSML